MSKDQDKEIENLKNNLKPLETEKKEIAESLQKEIESLNNTVKCLNEEKNKMKKEIESLTEENSKLKLLLTDTVEEDSEGLIVTTIQLKESISKTTDEPFGKPYLYQNATRQHNFIFRVTEQQDLTLLTNPETNLQGITCRVAYSTAQRDTGRWRWSGDVFAKVFNNRGLAILEIQIKSSVTKKRMKRLFDFYEAYETQFSTQLIDEYVTAIDLIQRVIQNTPQGSYVSRIVEFNRLI